MAKPIALEIPARDARAELIARLESAPVEHAEALLDAYQLLQELHDRRVLEFLRGVFGAGGQLTESAARAAEAPESIAALRNMIIIAKTLGTVNPELVQCIASAAAETLGSARKPVIEPPGLMSLLGQFRRKELRRSIALINRFLETLGNQLKLRGNPGRQ
jgi:uncharacterized protein YjgD (DUF1641 family)